MKSLQSAYLNAQTAVACQYLPYDWFVFASNDIFEKKVFWFRRQRYAGGDWETDWAVRRGGSKVWLLWFLKATFSPHALFFFPWVELKSFLLSWQNLKWQKITFEIVTKIVAIRNGKYLLFGYYSNLYIGYIQVGW